MPFFFLLLTPPSAEALRILGIPCVLVFLSTFRLTEEDESPVYISHRNPDSLMWVFRSDSIQSCHKVILAPNQDFFLFPPLFPGCGLTPILVFFVRVVVYSESYSRMTASCAKLDLCPPIFSAKSKCHSKWSPSRDECICFR